jgi:hypothetical protein
MRLRSSVILSIFFIIPFLSSSQPGNSRIRDLYRYVQQTDSLAEKATKNFYLEKFLKDGYNYRETWRYLSNGSRIIYFQVDYMLDSTEFTEVYYLNRGNLVCSEEYEKVNYSMREDELKWGGIYYFESSMPKHVVTLGRQRYYRRNMDPGMDALLRFGKRFSELKRHLPMLPANY